MSIRRRDDIGRAYLNKLDPQTAVRHLGSAAREVELAGARAGDIVHREAEHAWENFDRRMEMSQLLGGGPGGSAFDFTRWGGVKKAGVAALEQGENVAKKEVKVLRSQMAQVSSALGHPYPSSSTPDLRKGVSVHGQFANRYLDYAEKDALQAARQAGMAGKYAMELGRRELAGILGDEEKTPSSIPSRQSPPVTVCVLKSQRQPLEGLFQQDLDRQRRIQEGLDVVGVAGDLAGGYALGKYLAKREKRKQLAHEGLSARQQAIYGWRGA
ncbi:hypothetical protein JCM5296_002920 [Sporobolomyces johnsonii]